MKTPEAECCFRYVIVSCNTALETLLLRGVYCIYLNSETKCLLMFFSALHLTFVIRL